LILTAKAENGWQQQCWCLLLDDKGITNVTVDWIQKIDQHVMLQKEISGLELVPALYNRITERNNTLLCGIFENE